MELLRKVKSYLRGLFNPSKKDIIIKLSRNTVVGKIIDKKIFVPFSHKTTTAMVLYYNKIMDDKDIIESPFLRSTKELLTETLKEAEIDDPNDLLFGAFSCGVMHGILNEKEKKNGTYRNN